jgi:hypothetical protein
MKQSPVIEAQASLLDDEKPEQPQALVRNHFDLLQLALQKDAAIDVIERLAKLQLESRKLDAEVDFNEALGQCQEEAKLVINDSDKTGPGGKKWATYKALDREIRPIYRRHGFSISFGSADSSNPDRILVTCQLSRGMHSRNYQLPMDASGEGAKGGGALSKPHAILAAMEYGRRCLLKSIFNLVTGEEDVITNGELAEQVEYIQNASTPAELATLYSAAYEKFELTPAALKVIVAARKARKKEMGW